MTYRETLPPTSVSLEQVIAVLRQTQIFLQDLALRPDLNDDVRRTILDHLNGGEWFPDICIGVGNTIGGGIGGSRTSEFAEELALGHGGRPCDSLELIPPVPLPFPLKVEFPDKPEGLKQDRPVEGSG